MLGVIFPTAPSWAGVGRGSELQWTRFEEAAAQAPPQARSPVLGTRAPLLVEPWRAACEPCWASRTLNATFTIQHGNSRPSRASCIIDSHQIETLAGPTILRRTLADMLGLDDCASDQPGRRSGHLHQEASAIVQALWDTGT